MRILLSNDDGYLARGLNVLHAAMQPLGEVTVMAPEQNCSGASNSLTLSRPLTIHTAANGFNYVNGTPTDSVHIALAKAGEKAHGAAMASDAFFPFPDGPESAAKAGVTAIIQPGGSVKDDEVIAVANKYNIAMVFTGVRHFRH